MGLIPPARYLSCMLHCMRDTLVEHQRADVYEVLTQPLGFAFEAELGTRDWWIGGTAEITFHSPQFNRGVSAWWEDVEATDLLEIVREEREQGRYVTFQTEWALVPYGAHYGFGYGDIHTGTIFDLDLDKRRLQVMDRMSHKAPAGMFGLDLRGWVDFSTYQEAFAERLRILRYRFEQEAPPWPTEFMNLLKQSVRNMKNQKNHYSPHLHMATGLTGIEYLAKTLKYFRPSFRSDEQVQMLLSVRFQDNIQSHIIGNRFLLLKTIQATLPPEMAESLGEVTAGLEGSIAAWRELARVIMQVVEAKNKRFDVIADQVFRCAEAEMRLIETIEANLKGSVE